MEVSRRTSVYVAAMACLGLAQNSLAQNSLAGNIPVGTFEPQQEGCLDPLAHGHRKMSFGNLATGPAGDASRSPANIHPWPFPPLSIGHTNASYQHYTGLPYFHHGLDIRGDAGTSILASAGGKVTNIENYIAGNPAYWEVAILDDQGYLWQYHHIEKTSIPASVWNAWRGGSRIEAGTKLGEIFRWSAWSFGERYDHLHLNVIAAGGTFMSPFLFLESLPDSSAPAIIDAGVLGYNSQGEAEGDYSLYATIHDLILHTKYVVPPHRVEIAVDNGAPELVWDFRDIPGKSTIEEYVDDFFVPEMTCGDYNCRKLTIDLGFAAPENGAGSPPHRRKFPSTPGRHSAVVTAFDFEGNSVSKTIEWTVSKVP
jgi:hypothetical protein